MEKKELSMETRLLIAFGLMGVVLLVTPYIFKQPTPPPNANKDGKDKAAVAAVKDATPAPQKTEAAATPQGAQAADAEETRTVETDLYRVVFSNRGAVVKSWVLKAFKDHGTAADTLTSGLAEAAESLKALSSVQVDLDAITSELQLSN